MRKIAFLASHNGSGMRYLLEARARGEVAFEPVLVVSNNPGSPALAYARELGIPAVVINEKRCGGAKEADEALRDALREHQAQYVVLSGYMKRIGPATLSAFPNRILNIHPSLLPKFGGPGMYGMRVHEAVIASGDTVTGATVHLVDHEYDHGPVLAQAEVPVRPGDTPESLRERVLAVEGPLYLEVLQKMERGEIDLEAFGDSVAL
ncbi:phosphoribosylglycinamide formyltransferase [Alicyclobacillus vulcanalis]|uniref:Phosphoribosylglycinamide formyltransferase n=1 Tax=Alicyclobacillus vulcanalis TaxID=252246 RepID=A0A1N7PP60_9BACL|nr:phosphoribosylglycinamide formyltransferase [Alicyclobacillus vulcanalis]SIT12386.1 phosphoribosylglycinamide formyltransferase-1 [Alicyclobacillus vulcanalis]